MEELKKQLEAFAESARKAGDVKKNDYINIDGVHCMAIPGTEMVYVYYSFSNEELANALEKRVQDYKLKQKQDTMVEALRQLGYSDDDILKMLNAIYK